MFRKTLLLALALLVAIGGFPVRESLAAAPVRGSTANAIGKIPQRKHHQRRHHRRHHRHRRHHHHHHHHWHHRRHIIIVF